MESQDAVEPPAAEVAVEETPEDEAQDKVEPDPSRRKDDNQADASADEAKTADEESHQED